MLMVSELIPVFFMGRARSVEIERVLIIVWRKRRMTEEICPRCQNRFWFFHGDIAVECPCVEEEETANVS